MPPVLAFERDPLFGAQSEPLLKIHTKIKIGSGCFWIWKEREFFWFWIEGSPDFFGLFCEGASRSRFLRPSDERWFEEAALTDDAKRLHAILRHQIHHGRWARAVTLTDPRQGKSGLWRVVWSRRDFLLQNPVSGRAIRFFPESHWRPKSPRWREMIRSGENAEFFAERLWPLFLERRGRLASAFEFLELPVDEQENPLRFGRGNRDEFFSLLRAALMLNYSWPNEASRTFGVRFHHRSGTSIYRFAGTTIQRITIWHRSPKTYAHLEVESSPRVLRLAQAFGPHLVQGFSFQSVASSPFALFGRDNAPSLSVKVVGPFSNHELIEASITLRSWLAHNAPQLLPDWK